MINHARCRRSLAALSGTDGVVIKYNRSARVVSIIIDHDDKHELVAVNDDRLAWRCSYNVDQFGGSFAAFSDVVELTTVLPMMMFATKAPGGARLVELLLGNVHRVDIDLNGL